MCVCARMRLFVTANSLIPQHVPETCNRCLGGEFANARSRKHAALPSFPLIPAHRACCSRSCRNTRAILGTGCTEQTKERFALAGQKAFKRETAPCFTRFVTNPVIFVRLSGIAKEAASQNPHGELTNKLADVCRPPDLCLLLRLPLM